MAVSIPEQRRNPDDQVLPNMPQHPLECVVEDCGLAGRVRYFPAYRITLCDRHHILAADRHRTERTYW